MTTVLAILVLAAFFVLFGLLMTRSRQGGCGGGCSCAPQNSDGGCSGSADPRECPLALPGPKTGGNERV